MEIDEWRERGREGLLNPTRDRNKSMAFTGLVIGATVVPITVIACDPGSETFSTVLEMSRY